MKRAARGAARRRPAGRPDHALRQDPRVDRRRGRAAAGRPVRGLPARAVRRPNAARVQLGPARRGGPVRGVPAHPGPHGGVGPVSGRPRRLRVIVEADGGRPGQPGPGRLRRGGARGRHRRGAGRAVRGDRGRHQQRRRVPRAHRRSAGRGRPRRGRGRGPDGLQAGGRADVRPLADQAPRPAPAGRRRRPALVRRFEVVRFTWIPRERNRRADALANAAMDGKSARRSTYRGSTRRSRSATPRPWSPPPRPVGGAVGHRRPPVSATRLVLVRHGETELTAQRRYSGRGDVPLSPAGKAQAEATAVRVAELTGQVAAVVSSPLSRCVRHGRGRSPRRLATAWRSRSNPT